MTVTVECSECDYKGTVSSSSSGKTISCPSCEESIQVPDRASQRRNRASHSGAHARPATDNSSGRIVLIGSTVVLLGVVGMLAIRMNQIAPTDQDNEVVATNPQQGPPATTPIPGSENTAAKPAAEDSDSEVSPNSSAPSNGEGSNTTKVEKGEDSSYTLPKVGAIDPQQLLMADMTEIVLKVEGFPEDANGTVKTAVTAGVKSALEKCKLNCSVGDDKPKMAIALSLKEGAGVKSLLIDAELQAELQGYAVKLWERHEAIVQLDRKALESGILPPSLDREVGAYFTTLRERIVSARRKVRALKESKKESAK